MPPVAEGTHRPELSIQAGEALRGLGICDHAQSTWSQAHAVNRCISHENMRGTTHTHYRKHSRKARSHSDGMHTCMTCWSRSEAHIISSLTFDCRREGRLVELADAILHPLPHPCLFFSLVLVVSMKTWSFRSFVQNSNNNMPV